MSCVNRLHVRRRHAAVGGTRAAFCVLPCVGVLLGALFMAVFCAQQLGQWRDAVVVHVPAPLNVTRVNVPCAQAVCIDSSRSQCSVLHLHASSIQLNCTLFSRAWCAERTESFTLLQDTAVLLSDDGSACVEESAVKALLIQEHVAVAVAVTAAALLCMCCGCMWLTCTCKEHMTWEKLHERAVQRYSSEEPLLPLAVGSAARS
jgi:hypothetical protein